MLLLNSIPGARKMLKPIFAFFVNFDDLWLYITIQESTTELSTVSSHSHKLYKPKKNGVSSFSLYGPNLVSTLKQFTTSSNYQVNYTSMILWVWAQLQRVFINTFNLFFSNLFLLLEFILTLRFFFYLLKAFKYIFSGCCFLACFALMFLKGNVQILLIYSFFET